jgi:hypothetical protein
MNQENYQSEAVDCLHDPSVFASFSIKTSPEALKKMRISNSASVELLSDQEVVKQVFKFPSLTRTQKFEDFERNVRT